MLESKSMTPRERLLTALHGKEPDRVPFLEPEVDERVALGLLGIPVPENLEVNDLGVSDQPVVVGTAINSTRYDTLQLVENLDLDAIGAYVFVIHQGTQVKIGSHYMLHGGKMHGRADLKHIHLPDPDDPALYEPLRQFILKYGPSNRALFCITNLGSDPVILGMGFEAFGMMLYDDRPLLEELFDLYGEWQARVIKHICELDFDFLWLGDDLAFKTKPYVSPRVFSELFMPHFRQSVSQITKPWIFHSDGNLLPILDDLLSLGMNGLHPIEPGAMDLGLLKQRYGQNLCLVGHISVDTLSRGTPEEVDMLVREAIHTAAPGGGYIAGSSNSIPFYALAKNVRAMQQAILKYGQYPISG